MGEPTEPAKPAKSGPQPLSEYYELTRPTGGSQTLESALRHVEHRNNALDLGSGSGRDSLYLLDQGFAHVVAVDANIGAGDVLKFVPEDAQDKLEFVQARFDEFDFGVDRFDLINAQFALPFNPRDTFNKMFERLKSSLRSGGLFVGVFFGPNDEWNTPGSKLTFHSREDIQRILINMEIIELLEEDEPDGRLANGTPKHWHNFRVTARKL